MIADRIDAENHQFDHVSKYEELLAGLKLTGRMWGKERELQRRINLIKGNCGKNSERMVEDFYEEN